MFRAVVIAWNLERNIVFWGPPTLSHLIFWEIGSWKCPGEYMVWCAHVSASGITRNYKVGERVSWNSIHLHCGTTIAVLHCAQGLSPGLYIVTSKLQVWSSLPGRQTHSCSWSGLSAQLGWWCFLIPVDVRDGEEQKEFSHGPCPSLNAFEPALAWRSSGERLRAVITTFGKLCLHSGLLRTGETSWSQGFIQPPWRLHSRWDLDG